MLQMAAAMRFWPMRCSRHVQCAFDIIKYIMPQVDKLNPQVASRIVRAFDSWKQYNAQRQKLMQGELKRILAHEGLSANAYEIASKSAAF